MKASLAVFANGFVIEYGNFKLHLFRFEAIRL